MPPADLAAFSLEDKSPEQLEQRRREIVSAYGPSGVDKIELMSNDHLKELAALTAALRRRTTPSVKKRAAKSAKAPKVSADDLLSQL